MANNKEEAGKGTPRPGEMPASRRPYATIDVRATEVEGREPAARGAAKPAATASAAIRRQAGGQAVRASPKTAGPPAPAMPEAASLRRPLASLRSRLSRHRRSSPTWRPGAVGAVLVLAVAQLLPHDQPAGAQSRGRRPGAAPGRRRERARHAPRTPACAPGSTRWAGRSARWATRRPSSPARPRRSKARSAAARRCRRS